MDSTLAAYHLLRHYMIYVDHYIPSIQYLSKEPNDDLGTVNVPVTEHSDSPLCNMLHNVPIYGNVASWEFIWNDPEKDPNGLRGMYKKVFPPSMVNKGRERHVAYNIPSVKLSTHVNMYDDTASSSIGRRNNNSIDYSTAVSITYEALAISKKLLDRPVYASSGTQFVRSVMDCERRLAKSALNNAMRVIINGAPTDNDRRQSAELPTGITSQICSNDTTSNLSPQLDSLSFFRQNLQWKHNNISSSNQRQNPQHQQMVKYPLYYHCMHFISSPVLDADTALSLYISVSEMTTSPNAMPSINMTMMEFFDVFIRHMNIAFPNYFDHINHALDCSAAAMVTSSDHCDHINGCHDRGLSGMLDDNEVSISNTHHSMDAYYPCSLSSNSESNEKIYNPPLAPRNMDDGYSDVVHPNSGIYTASLASSPRDVSSYLISSDSKGMGKTTCKKVPSVKTSKSTGLSGVIPGDYILRAVCFFFKCNKIEALIRYISPLVQHGILLFNDSMTESIDFGGVSSKKVKKGGSYSENKSTLSSKSAFLSAIYPLRHLTPADGSSKGFVAVSDIVNSFESCSTFYCLQSIKQGGDLHNILHQQPNYEYAPNSLVYGPLPPAVVSPVPLPSFLSNWPHSELTTHFIAIFSSETAIEGQSDVMYMSSNHQLMLSYTEISKYAEELHSKPLHDSFLKHTNDNEQRQDLQNVVLANAMGPDNFRRNFIGGFIHWMCLASLSARRGPLGTLNEACMIVKSDACTVAFLALATDNSSIGCGGDDPAAWKPVSQRGKSEKSGQRTTEGGDDKSDTDGRDTSLTARHNLKGNNKPLSGLAPDNVTIAIGFPQYIGEQEIRKGIKDVLSGTEMAIGPLEALPMAFYDHEPEKMKKVKVNKYSDNHELTNEIKGANEVLSKPAPGVLFREACVPVGRTLLSLLNAVFYAPQNPLYKLSVPRVLLNCYSPMMPVSRYNETNILVSGFDRPTGIHGFPNAAVAAAVGGSPSVVRPCVKPYNSRTVIYATKLLQMARECTEVKASIDDRNDTIPLCGSFSAIDHSSVKCLAVAIFFRGQLVVTDTHPTLAAHLRLAYIAAQHYSEREGSSATYDEIRRNALEKQVTTFNRLKSGILRDFITNLTAAPEMRRNFVPPPPWTYSSIPPYYHTPQPRSVFEECLLGGMGPPLTSSLQRRYPILSPSECNGEEECEKARLKLIKQKEEENLKVASDPCLWRRGIKKDSASDYAAAVLDGHLRERRREKGEGSVSDIVNCDVNSHARIASLEDANVTVTYPPFSPKSPTYFPTSTSTDMVCSSGFEVCLNKQCWALLWSANPKVTVPEIYMSKTQTTAFHQSESGSSININKGSNDYSHVYKDPVLCQDCKDDCKTKECANEDQGERIHSKSIPVKDVSTRKREGKIHAALQKKLRADHRGLGNPEDEYPCERLCFNGVEIFILMDRHLPLPKPLAVLDEDVSGICERLPDLQLPNAPYSNVRDICDENNSNITVQRWRAEHLPVRSITPASHRIFNRLHQNKCEAQWEKRTQSGTLSPQSHGLCPSLSLRATLTEYMCLLRYSLVYYDIIQKPQPNNPTAAHKPLPNTCALLHTKTTATTVMLEASPYDNRIITLFGEHDSNPSHNKNPMFPLTATQVASQNSKGLRPPPSTGSINRANQLADEARHITSLLGAAMLDGVAIDNNMRNILSSSAPSHGGGGICSASSISHQHPHNWIGNDTVSTCESRKRTTACTYVEETAELSPEHPCEFATKPITRAILGRSSFGQFGDRGGVFSLLYGRETAERTLSMGSCAGHATIRNSDDVFLKFAKGAAFCQNINLL